MKFKTLKNNDKKIFLFCLIIGVTLLITLLVSTSLAKYRTTKSINIASGTINYSPSDLNIMAIYVQSDNTYEQQDIIPESGYTLNSEESYCKLGDSKLELTIGYDTSSQTLSISPMTNKGTKCYLYFDIYKPSAKDIILANMTTVTTRSSFSSTYTSSTTGTIFTAEDDDGTSYYFAGAPTDNWVKFAGFYWRIIRINGDGTIRLIYNGTSTTTTGTKTQTTTSAFNSSRDNNAYVGYMYTIGSLRGLGTSSTIKGVLENWYDSNLASYASSIDTNAGFCGDRTPSTSKSSSNGSGGTGTTTTYYGSYNRRFNTHTPTLKCENSGDLYTLNGASKGNKALTKPIGLITMDEVGYAGADMSAYTNNTSYYLYTNQFYWTMSPYYFDGSHAHVFLVNSYGCLSNTGVNDGYVDSTLGVRPVINLKADTLISSGSGTAESPYIIAE